MNTIKNKMKIILSTLTITAISVSILFPMTSTAKEGTGGEDRLMENGSIKAPDKELLEAAKILNVIKKPKKLHKSDAAIRKAGTKPLEY